MAVISANHRRDWSRRRRPAPVTDRSSAVEERHGDTETRRRRSVLPGTAIVRRGHHCRGQPAERTSQRALLAPRSARFRRRILGNVVSTLLWHMMRLRRFFLIGLRHFPSGSLIAHRRSKACKCSCRFYFMWRSVGLNTIHNRRTHKCILGFLGK